MTVTVHHKKHCNLLKTALFLLLWVCVLLPVSCKENGTGPPTEKTSDKGIHETFERGPIMVRLDIDRSEITIADRLNLKITVIADEDYEIEMPGFGEKLEQFGIIDYDTTQPELLENNRKKISRSYVLEPFLSGDYIIPPMEISFWKGGERESGDHKIETTEAKIKVKSLLPEDLKDVKLKEIKPPVAFPRSHVGWVWAGISAAVICVLVVVMLVILKKRKKAEIENAAARIPAHELAYEELKLLVADGLADKGQFKLFYYRISGILRRYIENRFGLHASEQTTEEFLLGIETSHVFTAGYKTLLKTFLSHCDLVKFAEYRPKTEDVQKTFDSCKAFIEETKE